METKAEKEEIFHLLVYSSKNGQHGWPGLRCAEIRTQELLLGLQYGFARNQGFGSIPTAFSVTLAGNLKGNVAN